MAEVGGCLVVGDGAAAVRREVGATAWAALEVLVSQVLRPTSAKGEAIVDPDDELPENFRLETIAEKRFGARWIRISRVMEILPETVAAAAPAP